LKLSNSLFWRWLKYLLGKLLVKNSKVRIEAIFTITCLICCYKTFTQMFQKDVCFVQVIAFILCLIFFWRRVQQIIQTNHISFFSVKIQIIGLLETKIIFFFYLSCKLTCNILKWKGILNCQKVWKYLFAWKVINKKKKKISWIGF